MRGWVDRAFASVLSEWHEAPWFVILTITVVALVGPGIVLAAWLGLTGLFG